VMFAKLGKLAVVACASALVGVSATAPAAHAEGWGESHPRREEVNDRLAHENHRIDQERRDGEISRGEARRLHREDHQIRNEERRMASRDGGHITRFDQHVLNRQENAVSHQINRAR